MAKGKVVYFAIKAGSNEYCGEGNSVKEALDNLQDFLGEEYSAADFEGTFPHVKFYEAVQIEVKAELVLQVVPKKK